MFAPIVGLGAVEVVYQESREFPDANSFFFLGKTQHVHGFSIVRDWKYETGIIRSLALSRGGRTMNRFFGKTVSY
jgi:hypothetical protein